MLMVYLLSHHGFRPDTLQVGRKATRAGRRNEQVPPKVEVQGRQVRVRVLGEAFDAFVRGQIRRRASPQVQRHTVEPRPVLRLVRGSHGLPTAIRDTGEHGLHTGRRIARHVPVVHAQDAL